jgi:hypothetical protein
MLTFFDTIPSRSVYILAYIHEDYYREECIYGTWEIIRNTPVQSEVYAALYRQ